MNSLIDKLPIELHIPTYNFCGPGTRLEKRLKLGQKGINPLDSHCREHDIAYSIHKSVEKRHEADKVLEDAAWRRFKSKDASLGEKAAAWSVTTAMKAKRKMGMGMQPGLKKAKRQLKKKQITFKGGFLGKIKKELKKEKCGGGSGGGVGIPNLIMRALDVARMVTKQVGGKKKIKIPRVLPLPKEGGFLPLVPLFAGLSALGALIGGGSQVAKAITNTNNAKRQLEEGVRHNKKMEAIALGAKKGEAIYLRPYKKGAALVRKKYKASKNYPNRLSRRVGKRKQRR